MAHWKARLPDHILEMDYEDLVTDLPAGARRLADFLGMEVTEAMLEPHRSTRTVRTASRQQRRMLAAMYSRCAHPHCEVAFSQCRIHHVLWWTKGGKTVRANLLPLCEQHHHLVHEGGWDLAIDHQRRVTWSRPDGTVWLIDDGPNRVPSSTRSADRSTGPPRAA